MSIRAACCSSVGCRQIGGFVLIDCPDLDVAIELAAAHPLAPVGRIEVLPVWP
jgi:hypothetical protein